MTTVLPGTTIVPTTTLHAEYEHDHGPDVCHRLGSMGTGICGHGTYGVPAYMARRSGDRCVDCGIRACPECESISW